MEIRNFGRPDEEVLTYPHPDVRLRNGTEVHYLHRDHLGTVRSITDASAALVEERRYRPFGEITWTSGGVSPDETLGFIGERYDSDAGLQYLNARYYDPRLGIFIQPDWFEVTEPGVGTNRYSYSFNDPVNLRDPGGNDVDDLFGDHSLDPDEYEAARNLEGQLVDEARTRAVNEAIIESLAIERFGRSFDELNWAQKLRVGIEGAAIIGAFGPEIQHMAISQGPNDPFGSLPTGRLGRGASGTVGSRAGDGSDTARLTQDLSLQQIASGHGFTRHVLERGEFSGLGIRTREQYLEHIRRVVDEATPTSIRQLERDRTAYWHPSTGTVVIVDPRSPDRGTAFQPTLGRQYFDTLR